MAYCRGVVYLFPTPENDYYCQCCKLVKDGILESEWSGYCMSTLQEVKEHLLKHREHGNFVPDSAFERIEYEMKEEENES